MKICAFSAAFPIQGGTASKWMWNFYFLAEAGHQIVIITNSSEIKPCHCILTNHLSPTRGSASVVDPTQHPNIELLSTELSNNQKSIANDNPVLTKLLSLGLTASKTHSFDLIIGTYLEPYGVAASMLSEWTGVPYVLSHAGSDLFRLMKSEYLQPVLEKILLSARFILTTPRLSAYWESLKRPENTYLPINYVGSLNHFFESTAQFDFALYQRQLQTVNTAFIHANYGDWINQSIDFTRPILGLYGKTSSKKGYIEFFKALMQLKADALHHKFSVVALIQGPDQAFSELSAWVKHELADFDICILPFIPNWLMPAFITSCEAVFCLETNFKISAHNPIIPNEILAAKGLLVVSEEIAKKQSMSLVNGYNCMIVDPTNPQDLAGVIKQILTSEINTKQQIRENGRNSVLSLYQGKEKIVSDLDRLFCTIADRGNDPNPSK